MFGYFGATDRLEEFVDAVFLFNLSYSGQSEGLLIRFVAFFAPEKHPFVFDSAWPLWIGGAGGAVWLIIEVAARRSQNSIAIVLLVVGSYVATCLPARFWPHYYYLLIPPLVVSLSVALGLWTAWLRAGLSNAPALVRRGVVGLLYAIIPLARIIHGRAGNRIEPV